MGEGAGGGSWEGEAWEGEAGGKLEGEAGGEVVKTTSNKDEGG